jgi:tetratricopeptide (TPR) repeat protein
MALEGPLKELHIQDVFQLLDLGRKSGVLRVTSELRQTAATVCFDRGGVVSAALGSDPHPIGTRLVRVGKITGEALDRARGVQNSGDERRLGDILVSLGAISRRELDRQLKSQVEEAVFELLGWTEGYFRFEEGSPSQGAVEAPVRFPTEALLMEAARRLDEWSRIGSKVSHLGLVPRLPPPDHQAAEPLDLVPFEWEVLAAVDGQRDLHALADVLGRSEFEVARTVYGLSNAGVVVLDDPSRPGAEPEAGRDLAALLVPAREALAQGEYEIAAGALEELLRLDPLMPEARRMLGVCQAAQGRFREALESWGAWQRLGPRSPGEEVEQASVDRMRGAVETLVKELDRYRD